MKDLPKTLRAAADMLACDENWREFAEACADAATLIERLPKTADGVPIYPGMTLYCYFRNEMTAFDVARVGLVGFYDDCYSTRVAAEKARRK